MNWINFYPNPKNQENNNEKYYHLLFNKNDILSTSEKFHKVKFFGPIIINLPLKTCFIVRNNDSKLRFGTKNSFVYQIEIFNQITKKYIYSTISGKLVLNYYNERLKILKNGVNEALIINFLDYLREYHNKKSLKNLGLSETFIDEIVFNDDFIKNKIKKKKSAWNIKNMKIMNKKIIKKEINNQDFLNENDDLVWEIENGEVVSIRPMKQEEKEEFQHLEDDISINEPIIEEKKMVKISLYNKKNWDQIGIYPIYKKKKN